MGFQILIRFIHSKKWDRLPNFSYFRQLCHFPLPTPPSTTKLEKEFFPGCIHSLYSQIYLTRFHLEWDKRSFADSAVAKESASAGYPSSIPGSGSSPGERIGYPLQYSSASLVAHTIKRVHQKCGRPEFDPWIGKIPWRKVWQPSPFILPGESPWTEEPGGQWSMGLQRARTWLSNDWAFNNDSLTVKILWRLIRCSIT